MTDLFAQWQSEATEERTRVEVCFDRAVLGELQAAIEQFTSVKAEAKGMMETPEQVTAAAERIKELDDRRIEATRKLEFRTLAIHEWEDLAEAHPATAEQKERNPRATVNMETFEPAAAAACCVEPGITLEQATWLREFLPRDEWSRVWQAIHQANVEGTSVPKSVSGIVDQLLSELRSIEPAKPESPSPS